MASRYFTFLWWLYAYCSIYAFWSKKVKEKSGLNAWNGAPKSGDAPRPINEVYIPTPIEFHRKHRDFFCKNILDIIEKRKRKRDKDNRPEVRFHLLLPNGKKIPALLTGDNMNVNRQYNVD